MDIIPRSIVFRPGGVPYFTSINNIWYVAGRETLLPVDKIITIKRTRRPEDINVYIIRHVMKRQVKHRDEIEPVMYVIASFTSNWK